MGPTPDQIKRDIDRTRAELVADANRLVDHTSPKRIAQRRVRGVRDGLTTLKERVMGTASDTTSTLHGHAHGAKSTVAEKAGQAAEAVQAMPQQAVRQTQGNPLAAGLIAFGGGLLAATLLPRTRTEEQAVQQLGERASGVVEPVKEALSESAQHLREDAMSTVGEAAAEVKQTASDAARTTAEHAKESAQQVADRARESGQRVSHEARG
ncbi:DUF3618 domain-containing protein [Saccharothrix coeruleofusca]|uniref:DUF3618 domain-containing protein n=1 Tax=Saccharothrix coeruleofusca TaxID=33919 RepID=A0A918EG66_9PSEU|nr:DUF3618 domain-containing protein [Saccharothrix coeruleofusca]MBP2335123.1 ElaB/YqjD/DUF883 family membrane-anchored ribosome-binding protein [Saccharothrix coeruleofusca]GGP71013.1 hypothetical protein GCM10010185_50040 [Saccharothrix coeruleofusca]